MIKMVSDEVFYGKFRDWIIGVDDSEDVKEAVNDGGDNGIADGNNDAVINDNESDQKSGRVAFFLHQMNIIPDDVRVVYNNMLRAYPSSPLFLLLGLGSVGTNIARYSAVRRKSAHESNVIRTGCFYKFLAPSRFGKGIAMGFIGKLGGHIENI